MARQIAQLIVAGAQVVGKAFVKALRQEIAASQAAAARAGGGAKGESHAASTQKLGISLQEAKQILHVEDLTPENIEKRYEYLYNINDKTKGGSFYLQSKIVRAKERLDAEIENVAKAEKNNEKKKFSEKEDT